MYYYSQAISRFTQGLTRQTLKILSTEMGVKTGTSRFYYGEYTYPLHFVCFEKESLLGFFDARFLQIGIHRHFLFSQDEKLLLDVLRHELVHYLVHIKFGADAQSHGKEFHHLCRQFGYGQDVSSALFHDYPYKLITSPDYEKSDILLKAKKLMRLSESSNQHEAQLALNKANQLLRQHGLSLNYQNEQDSGYRVKVIYTGRKLSSQVQALSQVLNHFWVRSIFHYGRDHLNQPFYQLEIFGKNEHIEFADYIFDFLLKESQRLWLQYQVSHSLKGLRAKNSFIRGLADGFISSLSKSDQPAPCPKKQAITQYQSQLAYDFQKLYRSRQSSSSSHLSDNQSQHLGQRAGSQLKVRKPLFKEDGNLLEYIHRKK